MFTKIKNYATGMVVVQRAVLAIGAIGFLVIGAVL